MELELKKFAERRTDIFGTGTQETIIGRKVSNTYLLLFSYYLFFSRLVKKIDVLMIKFNGMVIPLQVKNRLFFFRSHI